MTLFDRIVLLATGLVAIYLILRFVGKKSRDMIFTTSSRSGSCWWRDRVGFFEDRRSVAVFQR